MGVSSPISLDGAAEFAESPHASSWLNRITIGTAVVALFFCALWMGIRAMSAPIGAQLQVSQRTVDLGLGKSGELLTGSFELRNIGSEPLEFAVVPSCSCGSLLIAPLSGTIPPAGHRQLHVEIKADDAGPSKSEKAFAIKTNDSRNVATRCSIIAGLRPLVRPWPKTIEFGEIFNSDLPRALLILSLDASLVEPGAVQASSQHPAVHLRRVNAHQLEVSLNPGSAYGDIYSSIDLSAASQPNVTLEVPVHAHVVPRISVAPTTIILPTTSKPSEPIVHSVLVWSNTDQLGNFLGFDAPAGVQVRSAGEAMQGRQRVFVSVSEPISQREEVQITFDGQDEPATIILVPGS
mgnify:CR=1 FL=1